MKYRTRIYYTEEQKALMWDRWQQGDSLHQIAQLFDRNHSSIQRILAETGGIRPAARKRSRLALSLAERKERSRAVVAGHSIRSIATSLGRAPSTISREIRRNGGLSCYRANRADQTAWDRAHRPKSCKLVENRTLARIVKQAPVRVVTGANCWVPRARLSRRRDLPRVARNDLSQPLHSGPWCLKKGAVATSKAYTRHASVSSPYTENGESRRNHRHYIN